MEVRHTFKRIFCKIDTQYKNSHSFDDDITISLNRGVDNFDRKYTQPINAIVISSENIPTNAEMLCHHNSCHATYQIFDYEQLSSESISSTIKYFSIPETECYAWRLGDNEWTPCNGFEFGLRVFKPYLGSLYGLLPTQIKNKLYVTTGKLKGKVVMTKTACDYEMCFQDKNGKESKLIRFRHFEEPENIREEVICIDHETTENVERRALLIGLSSLDCKTLNG
jgi:hypothetical protein